MVATSDNPLDGGIALCPHPRCRCFATWAIGFRSLPTNLPDEEAIEEAERAVRRKSDPEK